MNRTAQLDLPFIRWRQRDIGAVNGPEFLQDGAWAVAKPGPLLPLLQSLPAHLGLDQVGPVLPDGTQGYVASLNAEGGLRVGELDVGAPEFLQAPVRNVGASPVAALAPTSLVFSLEPHRPGKLNTRRSDGGFDDIDPVPSGRARILHQEPADLPFNRAELQRTACPAELSNSRRQPGFDGLYYREQNSLAVRTLRSEGVGTKSSDGPSARSHPSRPRYSQALTD